MDHEETVHLTDAQMARVRAMAERLGVSVDEAATLAIEAGVNAKYVLPKVEGRVLPLRPKRDDSCP